MFKLNSGPWLELFRGGFRGGGGGFRLLFCRVTKFLAMMLLFPENVLSQSGLFKPSPFPFLQFRCDRDKPPCYFNPVHLKEILGLCPANLIHGKEQSY